MSKRPNMKEAGAWGDAAVRAKPARAVESAAPAPTSIAPDAPRTQRRAKGQGNEVGINLRLSPEAWTALGVLAAKQRRAKQELLLEALDLLLVHYGEEAVARGRQ